MAKSYTIKEATEILAAGTDVEEIASLYKHAPVLSYAITKLIAKAPEEFSAFVGCLPEYVTTTKVNVALRKAAATTDAESDGEPTAKHAKPAKKTKQTGADGGGTDYDSMSLSEIKAIIDERGLRDLCREKFGNARKPNAVKLLKAIDAGEIEAPTAGAADDADDEVEAGPYDGITAPELYKMCKDRGIKAAVKKPAKHYIDLLVADDLAKAAAEAEADDDDDWDDDVAEEPKAVAVEDDDDDDWDI